MSTVAVNLKVSDVPEHPCRFSIDFCLQRQEMEKHYKRIKSILPAMPRFVLEVPPVVESIISQMIGSIDLFEKVTTADAEGKRYVGFNLKDEQSEVLIEVVTQLFKKINQLDSKIYLHANFEKPIGIKNGDLVVKKLLQRFQLNACIAMDKDFYKTLEGVLRQFSPKMASSPIMAVLPSLASAGLQLEWDSVEDLAADLPTFKFINYSKSDKQ